MKTITALLSCTAVVALPTAAQAQTPQSPSGPAPQAGAPGAAPADDQVVSEVVVTGTRVSNPNIVSPTPVTALTGADLLKATPSNVADALNQLPAFRGSSNTRSQQVGSSPAQGNYLNLRNLGANRTLVLYDGVRVQPTNATGGVDTNVLPQLLIDRVDVVTGGASAAYGSDAVAGVVNFIVDKNFEGIKGLVQAGVSDYGDADSYRAGVAVGKSLLDGKLHVEASYERFKMDGFNAATRPNYDKLYLFTGTGTAANPFVLNSDVRFNTATPGGIIKGGPLNNTIFLGDNQTGTYTGTATGSTNLSIGGSGVPWPAATAQGALRTDQAFGRLQYDFSPAVSFHAQYAWAQSENKATSVSDYRFTGSGSQLTLFSGNPYLPTTVQAAMTAQNIASVAVGRASLEIPPFTVDVTNRVGMVNAGFDGSFDIGAKTWRWDLTYVGERSTAKNFGVDSSNVRFFAALDAVRDTSGAIVCRVSITNPGLYPGCVPANIVGPGSLSKEAVAYIRNETHWAIRNKMDIVAANLRGDLFDLPAGAVSVAVGGEARSQSLRQTSDSDPAIPISSLSVGIRGVPSNATINRTTIAGTANGSVDVKEGYAEVAAPLLRDLPLVASLDVNAAVRYTDYSTSGSVSTWKIGGVWNPISDLRLRATLSRDIAAPTLYQLYSGAQIVTGAIVDPHTGVTTQLQQITRGNASLTPEKAKTTVLGGVYSPSWFSGFNLSIDYYRINIRDAIITRSGSQFLQDCETSGGTAPSCAFIVRPLPFSDRSAANAATAVNIVPLNLAFQKQEGVDIESNYVRPVELFGASGKLVLRANINLLLHATSQLTASAPVLDAAGFGYNNQWVRATLSQGFQGDRLSLQLTERYIGPSKVGVPAVPALVFANYGRYKPVTYVDFNGAYKVGADRNIELFANVQNLLNKKAPINGPTSNDVPSTNPGLFVPAGYQYDIVGRYFTLGARFKY